MVKRPAKPQLTDIKYGTIGVSHILIRAGGIGPFLLYSVNVQANLKDIKLVPVWRGMPAEPRPCQLDMDLTATVMMRDKRQSTTGLLLCWKPPLALAKRHRSRSYSPDPTMI